MEIPLSFQIVDRAVADVLAMANRLLISPISHYLHVNSNSDRMVDVDPAVRNRELAKANAVDAMYLESGELNFDGTDQGLVQYV